MDSVIFSQIPSIVLKKHKPEPTKRPKKKISFWDDKHSKEVTSSREESDYGSHERDANAAAYTFEDDDAPPDVVEVASKEMANAIIQTDSCETKSVHTQTDTPSYKSPLKDSQDQLKAQLEANTLGSYRPMYSLPLACGQQPPLKIGLTLPRGTKRKVFYPDDENAD